LCLGASQQSRTAINNKLQKSTTSYNKNSNKNKKKLNNQAGMELLLILVRTQLFWLACLDFDFALRRVTTINNSNQQQAMKINNKLQQK
jgi:hypothetical protein